MKLVLVNWSQYRAMRSNRSCCFGESINLKRTSVFNHKLVKRENRKAHIVPSPVEDAEEHINPTKDQELFVEQPIDAALPPEEQSGEAPEPGVGHLQ